MGGHLYFQLISSKMMKINWKYFFFYKTEVVEVW
jgi:hypothetical protein